MARKEQLIVDLRPWSSGDLRLLERLMGDAAMTVYLGGPETPEQIRERHERYMRRSGSGQEPMFVISVGPEKAAAGAIGYWETVWHGQHMWEAGWSVLLEYQGHGIAMRATELLLKRARAEGRFRFLHAFPSIDNEPSNAICRTAGFELQGEIELEYPPGHLMRCNDWRLDLFEAVGE